MSQTPERAPLAEPEGVNAASAESTDEQSVPATPDVTGGGHPEDAPDPRGALTGYGAPGDDEELVGAPEEPSDEEPTSGQDSGSMD